MVGDVRTFGGELSSQAATLGHVAFRPDDLFDDILECVGLGMLDRAVTGYVEPHEWVIHDGLHGVLSKVSVILGWIFLLVSLH